VQEVRGKQVALHPRQARLLGISIVQRVGATRAAAARDKLYRQGLALHSACEFAAAAARFGAACKLGHAHAHATLSWMLIFGREGVAKQKLRAYQLADCGARLGCCDSKGALAHCTLYGHGCREDALAALRLARESEAAGSSYGKYMLGKMYRNGSAGLRHNLEVAAELYHAAAAQGLAEAQFSLGLMQQQGLMQPAGSPSARRHDHALRWYKLAAARGQPSALHVIGTLCESGLGVEASTEQAIRWYVRACRAGDSSSCDALKRLRFDAAALGLQL
jgi:TPR repeat protein